MMAEDEHYRRLERMYLAAPVNRIYRPTIKIGPGVAEVKTLIQPDFFHAADAVHGAVLFKLLDDAAYFAANSLIEDVLVLTVSFNLYFLRPVSSGELSSHGEAIFQSKRYLIAKSEVRDIEGRIIAQGSGSFMQSKIPLTADVGYL